MQIRNVSVLPFPRELVYQTYRDHLPELVPYLPNIDRIEIRSREEIPPVQTRFENHWFAQAEIPRVAQSFIKPDMLRWIDRALWNDEEWSCEWSLETFFFRDYVHVAGKNYYTVPEPGKVALEINGDLIIDVARIPGIPKFLAGTIQPQLESFITRLITPNLTTVARGLEEFLKKRQS